MIFKVILLSFFTFVLLQANAQETSRDIIKTNNGEISIYPILHSSMVITSHNKTIIIDPHKDANLYKNYPNPTIILITDIHGDHLDIETLEALETSNTLFIVPLAVADKLPVNYRNRTLVLDNRQGVHRNDFFITAVAMYNLPETENSRHPKGRGNGYVLTIDNKKIYISGDTSATKEMSMLYDIDIAFVCMNLPYTMDIYEAADAVLGFKPEIVYPYHYRGKNGSSDVNEFKKIVNKQNPSIKVRLKNWYPEIK